MSTNGGSRSASRRWIAAPDEAISLDELRVAVHNRGMPLKMLASDVTPVGLHYLLVHDDIPILDAHESRLEIGGHVEGR